MLHTLSCDFVLTSNHLVMCRTAVEVRVTFWNKIWSTMADIWINRNEWNWTYWLMYGLISQLFFVFFRKMPVIISRSLGDKLLCLVWPRVQNPPKSYKLTYITKKSSRFFTSCHFCLYICRLIVFETTNRPEVCFLFVHVWRCQPFFFKSTSVCLLSAIPKCTHWPHHSLFRASLHYLGTQ